MDVVARVPDVPAAVLGGVEGKNPVERLLGQLHQAHGVGVGACLGVEAAFRLNDGVDQVGLQVELRGLPLHQLRIALGIEQLQAGFHQPGTEEQSSSRRQHCQRQQGTQAFFDFPYHGKPLDFLEFESFFESLSS